MRALPSCVQGFSWHACMAVGMQERLCLAAHGLSLACMHGQWACKSALAGCAWVLSGTQAWPVGSLGSSKEMLMRTRGCCLARQGNSEEELPELVLACARVSRVDFSKARLKPLGPTHTDALHACKLFGWADPNSGWADRGHERMPCDWECAGAAFPSALGAYYKRGHAHAARQAGNRRACRERGRARRAACRQSGGRQRCVACLLLVRPPRHAAASMLWRTEQRMHHCGTEEGNAGIQPPAVFE
jgi:hypothetical protein